MPGFFWGGVIMGVSAMAEAFRAAGYQTPRNRLEVIANETIAMTTEQREEYKSINWTDQQDRLQRRMMQVAREAIHCSPKNWDGAKDAFYAKVRKDPDLLWELLAPYRAQAAQFWLTQAAAEIHAQNRKLAETPKSGGVQSPSAGHGTPDPANETGGHPARDHHNPDALRPTAAAGAAAIANVTRLSLLDTFKVNGQSIGDVTPVEANRWASSRERDARFVRLLTQNLPPDQPIKKYRTPDDAQALYAQAEACRAE